MPKRDPLPKEVLTGAANLFATGKASRRKAQALGVPGKRYAALAKAAEVEIAVFKTVMGGTLRRTTTKMARRLEAEADKLPLGALAVNLGILSDKERMLRENHPTSQSLHLHIKGDPGSALTAILGPAAAAVMGTKKPEPIDVTPADPSAP
jgi:hypothetical protein